jgi:ribosomal protein L3 glutamine methyltransferase
MNASELERALRAATSCEAWVEALAGMLASHELCFGHGTDNALDEAYWLVRGVQQWRDFAWSGAPDLDLVPRLVELARRRVERREPAAYLLGEAWFAGLRFSVDPRVLIPRSPLAELIENEFMPWCRLHPGDRVLDLGTGSGCLAIAIAQHCPEVGVDATEVSTGALAVAAANVRSHDVAARVRLLETDLFPEQAAAYRVIVANPPYVPDARLKELPAEYTHEPRLALSGGADGLDTVARIVARAASYLEPDGILVVEVGEAEHAFVERYPGLAVTWLEFERGGSGVLLATREQLTGHSTSERAAMLSPPGGSGRSGGPQRS